MSDILELLRLRHEVNPLLYDADVLAADEIERLRADRDCEKRLRKDSDDLATDLRQSLEAVIACPTDTERAHAVLQRIHGAEVEQLQALMTDARDLATCYVSLAQQVRLIARDGATPDGDEVNSPTLLWAEGWLRKLDAAL